MSLIAEIKKFFKKTIILSGCISTGRDIASAMQMGADFAYMGTRFINTKESLADEGYKDMIINSKADDIIYTAAVSGVNANFLKPSLEAMGINEDMWKNSKKIDFGKELSAAEAEAKAWKTIWSAGQGVTSISDSPSVKDLVESPWSDIESKFSSGDKLSSSFQRMNDSGVIVKLQDDIEGFIPMSKISKEHKKDVIGSLNEGDNLDVLVVEVKSDDKNITLMLDDSNAVSYTHLTLPTKRIV